MKPASLRKRFMVESPGRFRIADFDPAETAGWKKEAAKEAATELTERLSDLHQRLYAGDSWSLLVILQGVDAAGKDSAIRRAMAGLNPLGCVVHPFKTPSAEELDHDYLWRVAARLPARGAVAIFNRSHYEEVLVVRVHGELLAKQKLPPKLVTGRIWKERFEDINAFERHLVRNGTAVLKFHLRISKEEQKRRLLERLDEPAKRWKFSMDDIAERKLWDRYMGAYEDMIQHTGTLEAPWYVVPGDHKWFARLVITTVMVETLERLDLEYPKADRAALREMQRIRKALEAE
jgi:PPK2 family polyphosphate:nucleotide phosphotransferase